MSALSDLLRAQNDFLGVWVNYEALRMSLDLEMGTMQLDERGMWIDPGVIDGNWGFSNEACQDGLDESWRDFELPEEILPLESLPRARTKSSRPHCRNPGSTPPPRASERPSRQLQPANLTQVSLVPRLTRGSPRHRLRFIILPETVYNGHGLGISRDRRDVEYGEFRHRDGPIRDCEPTG